MPTYELLLIAVGPLVLVALWLLLTRTRFGMLIRAATENRVLAGALGIDEARLFTAVFALGAFLAGLAGALQLPREPANLGMDLAIIAEAFVVTVVGGLGSIPGAFLAALLIGLTKALCIALGTVEVGGVAIAFPKLTLVAEFVVMAVVLAVQAATACSAAPPPLPPTTPIAEQRALVRAARPRARARRALALAGARRAAAVRRRRVHAGARHRHPGARAVRGEPAVPDGHRRHGVVRPRRVLRPRRLRAPRWRSSTAAPMAAALAARAGRRAGRRRCVFGWFCVRLSGVYLAMLTLAFAQIVWSIAFQWDAVTGGSNGLVGIWPPRWLAEQARLLLVHAGARRRRRWSALALDRALAVRLRAARRRATRRCAPRRSASTSGATQWLAFALAGAFAGLAGGLYAFSKGSISPETLAIPRSVDALVMVLLGGLNALAGPLLGAAAFTWLQDCARARDRVLARGARRGDPAHRARVSDGHRRRAAARCCAGPA